MHAQYRFELVRGEDRSIPISFFYSYPHSRKQELVNLSGLDFFVNVKDWRTNEVIAQLRSDNEDILIGNLEDLEFIQVDGDEDDVTAVLVIFSHDVTEKFTGSRVVFELFAVSRAETKETRQCLMVGEIKVMQGVDYV